MASVPGRRYRELSAVTAGVKDVRAVIEDARHARDGLEQSETVLFLDEIHRFSRSQQDALLPAVENRLVVLVAATTENPSFSVVSPLLSRSLVLTLRPLDATSTSQGLVDRRGGRTLEDWPGPGPGPPGAGAPGRTWYAWPAATHGGR